jgi:hypothetical protein
METPWSVIRLLPGVMCNVYCGVVSCELYPPAHDANRRSYTSHVIRWCGPRSWSTNTGPTATHPIRA